MTYPCPCGPCWQRPCHRNATMTRSATGPVGVWWRQGGVYRRVQVAGGVPACRVSARVPVRVLRCEAQGTFRSPDALQALRLWRPLNDSTRPRVQQCRAACSAAQPRYSPGRPGRCQPGQPSLHQRCRAFIVPVSHLPRPHAGPGAHGTHCCAARQHECNRCNVHEPFRLHYALEFAV